MMRHIIYRIRITKKTAVITALCFCLGQGIAAAEDTWDFEGQPAPAAVVETRAAPPEANPSLQEAQGDQAPPAAQTADAEAVGKTPAIVDISGDLRSGTRLSAKALAIAPVVMKRNESPGTGKIVKPKDRSVFQLYDKIMVKPFRGNLTSFAVGDTVDVLKSEMRTVYKGGTVQIVNRAGRGVVTGFAGNRATVQIVDLWDTIRGGESIAKTVPFAPVYSDKLATPAAKLQATVVLRLGATNTPHLQEYIVINKGSADNIKTGDFFRIMEKETSNSVSEEVLEAQAISVTENYTTLVVLKIRNQRVNLGDAAFLNYQVIQK